MYILVGEKEYQLNTKLGTSMAIEKKFNVPIIQLFGRLGDATTTELIDIICISANKVGDKDFRDSIMNEWDYLDLFNVVQELVIKLMFSGTAEQNEKKLSKFPGTEQQKNAMRALLDLPIQEMPKEKPENLTGEN